MEEMNFFRKKTCLIGIIIATLVSFAMPVHAGETLRTEFMSLAQAGEKWGKEKFDAEKFKAGGEDVRASMVVDLIESNKYTHQPLTNVLRDLGSPDGYFQNDGIPAYLLNSGKVSGDAKSKVQEVWQVVFIPDAKWQRVKEVKIHKNCCYN